MLNLVSGYLNTSRWPENIFWPSKIDLRAIWQVAKSIVRVSRVPVKLLENIEREECFNNNTDGRILTGKKEQWKSDGECLRTATEEPCQVGS